MKIYRIKWKKLNIFSLFTFLIPTQIFEVGMSNSPEHETVARLFDPIPDPVISPPRKHSVDYYMAVECSLVADLILRNPSVVGYISFL